MMVLQLVFAVGLSSQVGVSSAIVDPTLSCPRMREGIEAWILKILTGRKHATQGKREAIARTLADRIMLESKKQGLDPLVMTAIGWIESSYRPTARGDYGGTGRRQNEVGTWQLIPFDSPVRSAARLVLGCRPSKRVGSRWIDLWRKYYSGKACKRVDIGARRTAIGQFTRKELADLWIGTWVAAREMRSHINMCLKRSPNGHRWNAPHWLKKWKRQYPMASVTVLERYLHYNWGPKVLPKHHYRWKLFRRYARVRENICPSVETSMAVQRAASRYNKPQHDVTITVGASQ